MLWRYIVRRLLVAVVQLAGITLAVFFLMRLLPADPVARLVGLNATPEAYALTKASLGLDKSIWMQLAIFLGFMPGSEGPGLVQGHLGESWVTGSSVTSQIVQFLPVTLELITYSFVVAAIVSIPLGILAAFRPRGLLDRSVFAYSLFAGGQPVFWWGLTFIFFFFFKWRLAPAPLGRLGPLSTPPDTVTGFITVDALLAGDLGLFLEAAHHLMLPVLTLAFVLSGPVIKQVYQGTLRVLESDFILYAKSAGLSQYRIAAYTLRNSFGPLLTLMGILYGILIGGSVLVEEVFSLGGLGQYAVRSILSLDFPAVQGVVLVTTAGSLLTFLAVDIVQVLLDPRVAQERA